MAAHEVCPSGRPVARHPAGARPSLGVRQLRLSLGEGRWARRRLQQKTSPPTGSTPLGSLASLRTRGRGGKSGGKPGPASSTAPGGRGRSRPRPRRARGPWATGTTQQNGCRVAGRLKERSCASPAPPRPAGLLRSAPRR